MRAVLGPTFNSDGRKHISCYYIDQLESLREGIKKEDLNNYEAKFLGNFWDRVSQYGRNTVITERQEDVLRNICRRLEPILEKNVHLNHTRQERIAGYLQKIHQNPLQPEVI